MTEPRTTVDLDIPHSAEERVKMTGYDRKDPDSYGKKLVGFDFNPSGDQKVAKLEGLYAEIIDILADDLMKIGDEDDSPQGPIYREAIMRALDAQMWAVKGVTWRK